MNRSFYAVGLVALFLTSRVLPADPTGPNLFPAGAFDSVAQTYNPWAGVDGDGNIHGLEGHQNAIGDDGNFYQGVFGPSVAVGDLNGDGKPDIVLADSKGYIWWFPNSGTPTEPKFTQGQIIPVWLGEKKVDYRGEGTDDIVPRIQLVNFAGDGKLGLAVGTYAGKFFMVENRGSTAEPNFPVTEDISRYMIPTHRHGTLWLNYLSPAMYPWFNPNVMDLITGEGGYSANSIWLCKNLSGGGPPEFNEDNIQKIIPGMGLEQLTPAVIDWNNDGKPDIICGDRTGDIMLYLNTSKSDTDISFAPGKQLTIGGMTNFGGFTTVATGTLNGNKLPDLLIGSSAGTILYAKNTGKLGAPDFSGPLAPLKGVNPFPPITVSTVWGRTQPAGVPDELVTVVNPSLEKGFTFPAGSAAKYALKFQVFPISDPTFPRRYYPDPEDDFCQHTINSNQWTLPLTAKVKYVFHCWAKGDSALQNFRMGFGGSYDTPDGGSKGVGETFPLPTGSNWSEVTEEFRFEAPETKGAQVSFQSNIQWMGQGTFYITDVSVRLDTDQ